MMLPLVLAVSTGAQDHSQGEGIVTVGIYAMLPGDSIQKEHLMKNYRYFIKGNKVLRRDSVVDKKNPSKKDSIKDGELTVHTTFTATLVHPIYLIDLEKQQTITFCKDSQLFVCIDTLDKHFEEAFYKPKNQKKDVSFQFVSDVPPQMILGKNCYTAQWINKGDTNYFRYTKEPLKVKSPINCMVPLFPYPILSLDTKITHPVTGEFQAFSNIRITELKEIELSDELFTIPTDAPKKYNVPLAELAKPMDTYSKDYYNKK